jgi:hypothetical protein
MNNNNALRKNTQCSNANNNTRPPRNTQPKEEKSREKVKEYLEYLFKTYHVEFMKRSFLQLLNQGDKTPLNSLKRGFAIAQDKAYWKPYSNSGEEPEPSFATITNESLFDDFCEVSLFRRLPTLNSGEISDVAFTLAHDAWAIAKLFTVKKDINGKFYIVPTSSHTRDSESFGTYQIEKHRFPQFVKFEELNENEKRKDIVPIETYFKGLKSGFLDDAIAFIDAQSQKESNYLAFGIGGAKKSGKSGDTKKAWRATRSKHTGRDGVKRTIYVRDGKKAVKKLQTVKGVQKMVYCVVA